ncbi:hypothetical protein BKA66DRAFT_468692 [Pyrenochaeta sp. MPI-SDFR-AT-0127]|nr:hypothetical protein BKA66DRAFT_468692 [Pyrenochaeta sp. MPI-SDFR-AT-0127]
MLAALLKLIPTLRWSAFLAQDAHHEQLAIDTCISAVQIYFPCDSTVITNSTCLCEQYLWHVACYDNHASTPSSHPNHAIAETDMKGHCRAAGSLGAAMVQRQYHLQRRQIGSILSSIGGELSSFLSSPTSVGAVFPSVIESETPTPSATPAISTTPRPSAVQSIRSALSTPVVTSSSAKGSVVPTPSSRSPGSTLATVTSNSGISQSTARSTAPSATSAASSSSASGPSTGLIVGAAIGGVAVLALIGIFIMLILRHKRKKSSTKASATESEEHNAAMYRGEPSTSTIAANSAAEDEKHVYHHTREPPVYQQGRDNEMGISANVWEIDGRERPAPPLSELEAPNTPRANESIPACLRVGYQA